jgi:hypothetical protein
MYQQTIDQILATIKTIQMQHENGYHISDNDWQDFTSAVNDVNNLYHDILKYKAGVKK